MNGDVAPSFLPSLSILRYNSMVLNTLKWNQCKWVKETTGVAQLACKGIKKKKTNWMKKTGIHSNPALVSLSPIALHSLFKSKWRTASAGWHDNAIHNVIAAGTRRAGKFKKVIFEALASKMLVNHLWQDGKFGSRCRSTHYFLLWEDFALLLKNMSSDLMI